MRDNLPPSLRGTAQTPSLRGAAPTPSLRGAAGDKTTHDVCYAPQPRLCEEPQATKQPMRSATHRLRPGYLRWALRGYFASIDFQGPYQDLSSHCFLEIFDSNPTILNRATTLLHLGYDEVLMGLISCTMATSLLWKAMPSCSTLLTCSSFSIIAV